MGARVVSLYLAEAPLKRFFALGSDYAWGRDGVTTFEKQIAATKKDIVGKDFVLRQGLNFLQKPYSPQKLARAVRECLDN